MSRDNVIKEDEDEKLVIVDTPPAGERDVDDDRRLVQREGDGPEDDNEGSTDEERAAIRERRRKEKQERKHRREEAIRRNNLEMEFLRKRNDDLERRLNGVEQNTARTQFAAVDDAIEKARNEFNMAEQVIAKAVAAGNGDDVTKAMRYRDDAARRFQQLSAAKANALKESQARQQAPKQEYDDAVIRHAQKFVDDNSWYDPRGNDEDSAIVLAIDNSLVKEGYDPRSEDYWDELRKRAARRLPERFSDKQARQDKLRDTFGENDDDEDERPARKPRGGPALGTGRETPTPSNRREVYISAERKQAMIDAGVWEDPVLREKYVKRYMEYDKQNKARR